MPTPLRRLRAALPLLPLLLALAWSGCDPVVPAEGETLVSGYLLNATGNTLSGRITFEDGTVVGTNALQDDEFRVALAPGLYPVTVEAGDFNPGYAPLRDTIRVDGSCCGGIIPPTIETSFFLRGTTTVVGTILSSQTGQGVANTLIEFWRQDAPTTGPSSDPELGVRTDAQGRFEIDDAPPGLFRMRITKEGYVPIELANVQIQSGAFTIDPLTLVEIPPVGSLRIILTWGDTPGDLDSHLTGPDGAGGRFHVFYGDRNPAGAGASLDLDDVNGNGPETVSITTARDGTYRYSVFNFTDQSGYGANNGIAGGTRVEVYGPSGLLRTFTTPASPSPTTMPANTWRVFEVTMSGGVPTFSAGNGTYHMASGSTDTTVFLTGGDTPMPAKAAM